MSKYILELKDDVQVVQKVGVTDNGNAFVMNFYKDQLEELTADYINEHFGSLQDDAYQRGLEDGKAVHDKGCEGCKYEGRDLSKLPCMVCSNSRENCWTAKQTDDEIKVGDEVEVLNSGNKYLIAWFAGTSLCGFAHDGVTCRLQPSDVRKTGRHFDIASILKEMQS